jgi:type II secretion system protein N
MTGNKIRFLYAGYIVLITGLFLYVNFPVQSVRSYLISRLKAAHPGLKLNVVEIRPILPPALKLENVNISYMNNPLVEISALKIGPVLRSLFMPGQAYFFQAGLYGGTIAGRLDLTHEKTIQTVALNSTLNGIQIARNAGLRQLIGRELAGTLGGEIRFEGKNGTFPAGLTISDGKVDLL